MKTIIDTSISLIIKVIFYYLYPFFDVKLYKEKLEGIIEKHLSAGWPYDWLFKVSDYWVKKGYPGAVPRYRILQKALLISYWALAYIFFYRHFPIWIFLIDVIIALIIAYHKMVFDYLYYVIGKQLYLLIEMQREKAIVYWLIHWWYSGDYEFENGFSVPAFQTSFFWGSVIYFSTSIVYLINSWIV